MSAWSWLAKKRFRTTFPRPMAEQPPPPIPPIPPIPASILALPFATRLGWWLTYGTALGIPVDSIFQLISTMLAAAKRQLVGKHLRLTITERLTAAKHAKLIPLAMRTLVQWIVSPESLIRWLKRYQQRRANSSEAKKDAGKEKRPWIGAEKVAAILRIYDSGLEGLSRIVGEMDKCGHKVVESTVRRVLTANGRPPVDGNHRRGSTWAQFWNRHASFLVGVDFMQIPVGIMGKIVNAFVFCAIEHDTRRVHLLGITLHPTDEWIANVLRTATAEGAPLAGRKFWLLDNDRKYGQRTTATLGKRALWTSVRAPDMNSVIERWNKSAKEECLNHVVFLSEEHLRQYVTSYVRHYNTERPHQRINNVPIGPWTVGTGEIVCDESLHGLLKSFRRAA